MVKDKERDMDAGLFGCAQSRLFASLKIKFLT
jgi:hypothetical protein